MVAAIHRGQGPNQSAAHVDRVCPRLGVERDCVASGRTAGALDVDRQRPLHDLKGICEVVAMLKTSAAGAIDSNRVLHAVAAELEIDLLQHRPGQVVDGKRVAPAAALDVGNFDAVNAQALRADGGGEPRALGADGHLFRAAVGAEDVERIASQPARR